MKYKAGDKVRIKSLDWYNENKDDNREIKFENGIFTILKSTFLGQIMTIEEITPEKQYILIEDRYKTLWTDEMIEGLVEEETKPNIIEEAKTYWDSIKDAWICPEGYIFKDENDNIINATKIVLKKKEKEYPKTYEECCRMLGIDEYDLVQDYRVGKIRNIQSERIKKLNILNELLICRDAYWKIAGEEMGLGKPWKPDWDAKDNHFYTIHTFNGKIECSATAHRNAVLIFPTAEMRDAFYENFKEEIEMCKEFL